jgi:magnesium transporter
MSEARFFHISPDGNLKRVATLAEALTEVKSGGTIWLDFFDPAKEELSPLTEALGVHPLSVEDCLDEDQVPKVEDFPRSTFIIFNCYEYRNKELSIEEVDFVIGENFLVTVSGGRGAGRRFDRKAEETIRLDMENVRKGPAFLLHVLLDDIVDNKFAAIEAIQEEIDDAEERVLEDTGTFEPRELLRLRRYLLMLRKSLFHEREIMVKICRRDSPFISERSIYHFRDIYDHLAKFFEAVEINREMITNLMEMYLSIINNRMAMMANRTNRIVRLLTLITTVFMPLTLLAGIGGMSEYTMMTGAGHWKIAYPLFLLGLAVVGIASYFALRWAESRFDDADK